MAALKKSGNSVNSEDSISKVVQEIEDENRPLMGEVSVAEDGIVHDVPLLAGYTDENGVKHTTFSYREMTGKDEEAINKADVRANPARIMITLAERCVTEIGSLTKKEVGAVKWSQIIRELYAGDLDYINFKIRELSKGKEVTFKHVCPHCRKELTTVVSTDEFTIKEFNGEAEVPFELIRGIRDRNGNVHKTGTIRPINGYDRELVLPIFKKNNSTAISLLMTRVMKFDDGYPVTQDDVTNMSLKDRDIIQDIMESMTFGINIDDVDITCTNCGEYLTGTTGESDFFF